MCSFLGSIFFVFYLNNYYAHNDTDRLHTESYLTNKKIIDSALMDDNKKQEFITHMTSNLIPPTIKGDSPDVEA